MKKLFLSAIAVGLLVSCSSDSEGVSESTDVKFAAKNLDVDMEMEILENTMFVDMPRVASKDRMETNTAKSFYVISYTETYQSIYAISDDEYNDLGVGYDLEANDGIYTSSLLYTPAREEFDETKIKYHASEKFLHHELVQKEFEDKSLASRGKGRRKPGGGIWGTLVGIALEVYRACDFGYTNSGTSSLSGKNCSDLGGCITISC